jgi:hypothetical protein
VIKELELLAPLMDFWEKKGDWRLSSVKTLEQQKFGELLGW